MTETLLHLGIAASLLLFGGIGLLSFGGMAHIDARRRAADAAGWRKFEAHTPVIPFAAIIAGRARFRLGEIGWIRFAISAPLYFVLLHGHDWFIGVSPYAE